MDAGRHPLIELVTNAEVVSCEGEPGDFRVTVRKEPRYVREDLCVACGLCVDECPQWGGNEFDVGLKARKAIYRPFPQSVPSCYTIDRSACLNRDGFQYCNHCARACEPDAIDFDQVPEQREVVAGAVVVAVGFQEFDARKLGQYGYGRFPDVVTSLEFERMLSASGVTQGHVVRPSDRATPKRIVFIQCVGARGDGGRSYCSRFCCMNAVKSSMLVRQHDPEVEEVTILYTDLRAFGKGFDDFVRRSHEEKSATYVRGRPAKIDQGPDGTLEVFVEDTLAGRPRRIEADLVVLSVAAAPNDKALELAKTLGIETDPYGFVARRDPAVSAVETSREGIYVCGGASGPQVIPDCVAQASAAAARAQRFLGIHRVEPAAGEIRPLDLSGPPRIGVMVCHCGINIAGVLDVEGLARDAARLPGVVAATTQLFSCSSAGQEDLVALVHEHRLNRLVVAACTPRTHEPVFRETCARIGFNPYLLEMVNIRDQCSWVHSRHPAAAQEKARDLIRMGVARARHLEPLQESRSPMTRHALVVGGGIAGIEAAADLAEQGFGVTLVEKAARLGGRLAAPNLDLLYPDLRPAAKVLADNVARLEASGAQVKLGTEVAAITGFVGNFEATLRAAGSNGSAPTESLPVGAIILAFGADLYDPQGRHGFGRFDNVLTSAQLEAAFCKGGQPEVAGRKPRSAAFILCVGSRENQGEGFTGCSRYCCPTAIKQAIVLTEQGVDVTIFYRDIRTISGGAEEMYRRARGMGVLFVRVAAGRTPEVVGTEHAQAVRAFDELLGKTVEVDADLVVLGVGMRPRQPETHHFHDMLKASVGLDGFFLERHPELAPVESAVEGVFLAGTVQGPKDIVDTVAQASAAAAKASVLLAHDSVRVDPAVASIDEIRCRTCGQCVDICEFHAPGYRDDGAVEINASLCKGCGTCASWCPSGAITIRHLTDRQVNAMIDAFFDAGQPTTTAMPTWTGAAR